MSFVPAGTDLAVKLLRPTFLPRSFQHQWEKEVQCKNTVAKFEEGIINKDNLPVLKSINKDILQGWEEKYK
jgi:hypothetical protein